MNKIVLSKTTSAIFLAIVLVTGIVALSSPSFITASALTGPLFTEDNSDNSYEPRGYQPEYAGQKSNSYESTKYGMDSYEKPSYRNDNYHQQPEYSTYTSNYKPQYSSYGQDSNSYYKSKDSNSSVNVKKVNCNNINANVNGLEITALPPALSGLLASEAEATDEGQYGASSYGSGEGSYGSGGQSGSDKDFKFVCINNNNNTVVVVDETTTPEPLTCVECFESFFTEAEIIALETGFGDTLEQSCDLAADVGVFESDFENRVEEILGPIEEERFNNLVECLIEAGIVIFPGSAPPPNG